MTGGSIGAALVSSARTRSALRRLRRATTRALARHPSLRDAIPMPPTTWSEWDALPGTCAKTYDRAIGESYASQTTVLPLSPLHADFNGPPLVPLGQAERTQAALRLEDGLASIATRKGSTITIVADAPRRYEASDVAELLQLTGHPVRIVLANSKAPRSFGHRPPPHCLVWLCCHRPDDRVLLRVERLVTFNLADLRPASVLYCDFGHTASVPAFALRVGDGFYMPGDGLFVERDADGVPLVTPLFDASVSLVRFKTTWTESRAAAACTTDP